MAIIDRIERASIGPSTRRRGRPLVTTGRRPAVEATKPRPAAMRGRKRESSVSRCCMIAPIRKGSFGCKPWRRGGTIAQRRIILGFFQAFDLNTLE